MLVNTTNIENPTIGISGSGQQSASIQSAAKQIKEVGATPMLLIDHHTRSPAADISHMDGLLLMGNDQDIDPSLYGQQRHSHTKAESGTAEGRARAEYENKLVRMALDRKMPLMGICGGMQRINVLLGGDLHQHIPELVDHNLHAQQEVDIAGHIAVQKVMLVEDTKLCNIATKMGERYAADYSASSKLQVFENSLHHQAVNHVAKGLRAAAYSEDKIPDDHGNPTRLIEAIEADPNGPYKDQFLIATQWHPEFGASPLGLELARQLKKAARDYARTSIERAAQHAEMYYI
jgi:gamma-glutamyl-gamma-aminobutyrate hydrolase PuuD